jgi:S1-C subfamily serine protease
VWSLDNKPVGGPLLDLYGRAVGLNIARAGRLASCALPAPLVHQIIADLKARPAGEAVDGQNAAGPR